MKRPRRSALLGKVPPASSRRRPAGVPSGRLGAPTLIPLPTRVRTLPGTPREVGGHRRTWGWGVGGSVGGPALGADNSEPSLSPQLSSGEARDQRRRRAGIQTGEAPDLRRGAAGDLGQPGTFPSAGGCRAGRGAPGSGPGGSAEAGEPAQASQAGCERPEFLGRVRRT